MSAPLDPIQANLSQLKGARAIQTAKQQRREQVARQTPKATVFQGFAGDVPLVQSLGDELVPAREVVTTGAIAKGQPIILRGGQRVDALQRRKPQPVAENPVKPGSLKLLLQHTVTLGGGLFRKEIYVHSNEGTDLIDQYEYTEFPGTSGSSIDGRLTNTGSASTDYSVGYTLNVGQTQTQTVPPYTNPPYLSYAHYVQQDSGTKTLDFENLVVAPSAGAEASFLTQRVLMTYAGAGWWQRSFANDNTVFERFRAENKTLYSSYAQDGAVSTDVSGMSQITIDGATNTQSVAYYEDMRLGPFGVTTRNQFFYDYKDPHLNAEGCDLLLMESGGAGALLMRAAAKTGDGRINLGNEVSGFSYFASGTETYLGQQFFEKYPAFPVWMGLPGLLYDATPTKIFGVASRSGYRYAIPDYGSFNLRSVSLVDDTFYTVWLPIDASIDALKTQAVTFNISAYSFGGSETAFDLSVEPISFAADGSTVFVAASYHPG